MKNRIFIVILGLLLSGMALSAKSPGRHYQQSFDTMFTNYLNRVYGEMQHLRNEEHTTDFIKGYLRFEIACGLYGDGDACRVLLESNDTFLQAIDSRTERRFSGNTKCILENRP